MHSVIKKISALDEGMNLSAEFNVSVDIVRKKYEQQLSKKFKGQKRLKFSKIAKISKPKEIGVKCLCYCTTRDARIRFFITEKITINNGYTCMISITDSRITTDYLIWYFNHDFVKDLISNFTLGAITFFIPPNAFDNIDIPIPKTLTKKNITATNIKLPSNPIRSLIQNYHKEYRDNIESLNYMAAAILAGAIGESILYNYLLEQEIDDKILEGKAFSQLLDFVKVSKTASNDFPFIYFEELQKIRNDAVHPSRAMKNIELEPQIEKLEFNCFNNIVKYFGL